MAVFWIGAGCGVEGAIGVNVAGVVDASRAAGAGAFLTTSFFAGTSTGGAFTGGRDGFGAASATVGVVGVRAGLFGVEETSAGDVGCACSEEGVAFSGRRLDQSLCNK